MQQSLILGFGRAGRQLHLHCLRKAMANHPTLFNQNIGVVDPNIHSCNFKEKNIKFFSNLREVEGFNPFSTVVHVCTPPELHGEALEQAAKLGFTKFIIEKPLSTTIQELEKIHEINKKYNLDILVVANWLSSSLTFELVDIIQSRKYGPLLHIVAEQNKARLSRTINNKSHGNSFDIEIPHLMALSLFLGGSNVEVVAANTSDMYIENHVFPHMGTASIDLLHSNGITSKLSSNLESPIRERCIRLYFRDYRIVGYYPCSQEDSYAWINIYSSDNQLLDKKVMYDDPLPRNFSDYYEYFNNSRDKPISDLDFNSRIVTALYKAKETCGLILSEEYIT
ncbi:Gfo/Idh/MocA family protein [Priestia filamentosa]|uniref:Gfo/Idh/MocA family protein n=1 Tax=Priestia filamentosa TaxID=1402861 RepID=UPI0002DF2E4F|nr:Gfo/Idh/MocA family oxidoreductase [Priestia filamentosa]